MGIELVEFVFAVLEMDYRVVKYPAVAQFLIRVIGSSFTMVIGGVAVKVDV